MEIEIHSKTLMGGLTAILLLLMNPSLNSDSLSLTTYYPAPVGVYERLEVNGPLVLPSQPANPAGSEEGAVYFNTASKTVFYYDGADWVPLTGSSAWTGVSVGSIPSSSGAAVKNSNSGNIGINKTNPSYKLDINGDLWVTGEIKLSGDFTSATPVQTTCQPKVFDSITANYGDSNWLKKVSVSCPAGSTIVDSHCGFDYFGLAYAQSTNPATISCCCFGKYMSAMGYPLYKTSSGLTVYCGPADPLPAHSLACGSSSVSGSYNARVTCNVCQASSTIP